MTFRIFFFPHHTGRSYLPYIQTPKALILKKKVPECIPSHLNPISPNFFYMQLPQTFKFKASSLSRGPFFGFWLWQRLVPVPKYRRDCPRVVGILYLCGTPSATLKRKTRRQTLKQITETLQLGPPHHFSSLHLVPLTCTQTKLYTVK